MVNAVMDSDCAKVRGISLLAEEVLPYQLFSLQGVK